MCVLCWFYNSCCLWIIKLGTWLIHKCHRQWNKTRGQISKVAAICPCANRINKKPSRAQICSSVWFTWLIYKVMQQQVFCKMPCPLLQKHIGEPMNHNEQSLQGTVSTQFLLCVCRMSSRWHSQCPSIQFCTHPIQFI